MGEALRQICTDCGYVYDPSEWGGIALVEREGWECPGIDGACGATLDKFDIVEPESPLDEEPDSHTDDEEPHSGAAVQPHTLHAERAEKAVIDLFECSRMES